MIEVSHLLRKAYIATLSPINYLGKVIPIYDTFEKEAVTLPVGNSTQCFAYILIHDITVNDDSAKCGINQNASIQVQVVTKFNANTGESLHSEIIGSLCLQKLAPNSQIVKINLDEPAYSWFGRMESNRPINSETATNRIFTKNYIFSHKINQ
jgi:hypothetical protein